MATISSTDNIFVTASAMGKQFFNFTGSGVESFNQLISQVRGCAAATGMVTINIRNCSKGWSRNQALYISA